MSIPDTSFQIKTITWSEFSFQTPILLQDENGPCPLIALVNTLLLSFEFDSQKVGGISNDLKLVGVDGLRTQLLNQPKNSIKLETLLGLVGNLIMSITEISPDYEDSASKLLDILPKLHTGLSVNPNLITGEFPPADISTVLFTNLFGLNFMHGWVLDSDIKLIQELETFDEVQLSILEHTNSNEESGSSKDQLYVYSSEWLEDNKSQMTIFGLEKLRHTLEQNEFTIFFRNNHFNTLFKGPDMKLYLLLTDTSFKNSKKIVWQSLTSISGKEDIFYTGDLFPILDEDLQDIERADDADDVDGNYQLIKQLQLEDDERMAQEMQDRFNTPRPQQTSKKVRKSDTKTKKTINQNTQTTDKSGSPKVSDKKKKPNCVIT